MPHGGGMGVSSMLDLLHIENIAVIEEADITFHPGFNALTGETGAGKSIVIDAMGAVLGQRSCLSSGSAAWTPGRGSSSSSGRSTPTAGTPAGSTAGR